jgi:hypothetical protein
MAPRHTTTSPSFKELKLNIPNELKKETLVESNALQPWHKSAPWLISAATILGLVIIFQR